MGAGKAVHYSSCLLLISKGFGYSLVILGKWQFLRKCFSYLSMGTAMSWNRVSGKRPAKHFTDYFYGMLNAKKCDRHFIQYFRRLNLVGLFLI